MVPAMTEAALWLLEKQGPAWEGLHPLHSCCPLG